jgi:hypothetical protein
MAKLQSEIDLERGIVDNKPAAHRVAEASRLLAMILLREDERVKTADAAWWARLQSSAAECAAIASAHQHACRGWLLSSTGVGPQRSR